MRLRVPGAAARKEACVRCSGNSNSMHNMRCKLAFENSPRGEQGKLHLLPRAATSPVTSASWRSTSGVRSPCASSRTVTPAARASRAPFLIVRVLGGGCVCEGLRELPVGRERGRCCSAWGKPQSSAATDNQAMQDPSLCPNTHTLSSALATLEAKRRWRLDHSG